MIYLKDGNIPLNEAWADEIYQEGNSTYQLTFKYPLNNDKWKLLTEETKLIADDLHGEQEFTIFEVVKEQGYITVYANQVATLLNYYSISSINVDRVAGNVVMTALAGAILRDCPFSFYSDITDKHTFNAANISAMDALIKEKHSIVGQWGGDLVREKYQVSLLKNGGSETEALFMYKKNMKSTQQTTSTKELRTRIHFRKKIEVGEGDNRKEQWLRVTVDSPLINKYKHIYEADMEVTEEDVKDLSSLTKYGEQYYRTTLCDMIEDSLELEVAGVGDVPVKIFDVANVYHEQFGIDVRKKITKYRYSPMGKKLKSVGFGTIQQTLGSALNAMVSDSVKAETAIIEQDFEVKLEKELKNADKIFDQKMNQMEQSLSDEIEQARAKAEEVKAAMTDQLNLKINQSKSEVTDRLQKEFDQKLSSASADLAAVRANLTQAESQLSGNISQIRSDVGAIRIKQGHHETEIGKQVAALNAAKTELAGVKSAQANYEQSTTRRLAELANVADGKANRSELVQTATELSSRIASVQASGRNLFLNSLFKQDIRKTGIWTTSTYTATIDSESKYLGQNALKIVGQDPIGKDGGNPKITYPATGQYGKVAPGSMTNQEVTISFYAKAENAGTILRSRLGNIWFKDGNVTLTTEVKRYVVKFSRAWTGLSNLTTNEWLFNLNKADTVWIWMPKFEVSETDTPYSEAPEDVENQISAVESTFKQRADSLEAGVNRLTEGLKAKADSSALTVLSDSIKQSVKSLETDTQNKLNSKLSTAEFEVRAGSIRQEILNATKDKADKALVTAEAGKLREELASLSVGGVNLLKRTKAFDRVNGRSQLLSETYNNCVVRYFKNADANSAYQDIVEYSNALYPELGGTYTLSFWAKGTGEMTTFFYGHRGYLPVSSATTSQGLVSKAGDGNCRFTLSVNWQRYYVVYKLADAPADATSIYKHVLFRHNSRSTTDEIWLAGVKLERGNLATDYSENPEDTEGLIIEAKATFERTAQGLRQDLTAVQTYVNADGTRAEALRTYSREETARQMTAERKAIESSYVGKATYAEDVKGISRRFEELTEGGVNLLRNSATLPTAGDYRNGKWVVTSGGNGTAQVVPVTSPPNPLIKSMIRVVNNTVGNKDLSQSAMALVVDQKYTVSCYARVASDSPSPTVGLLIRSWANNNDTNRKLHKTISNRDWQRYSFTFTADVVANSIQFGQSGAGSVEICAPKIELGTVATSWIPSPEDATSYADTKLAEYRQTVEGQFATISSQIGESLKKTDISITPGQITLGTGKVVNGQTLASLFVQNPESMQAITKLMRITGDLIVDGSITGRDLAAGAITTPHLGAGAVTAEVIGANAVTADKVKADDALLEKLTAGEALLRKLMAKDAFINRLQSIDFAADQINGGLLRSIDGSLIFDLNKNTLTMSSNTAAIKRVLPGHPTQFMRYETERKGNVDYTRTIIGSNRNGSEKFDSVTFAGLVVENSNKAGIEDSLRLYGDNTYFRHAQGEVGWNINAVTQRMAPATWQKESAIWARNFVVPKHRTPNGRDWVKLEETVAALWRLWEHAAGNQVTMTGAMRDKVRELFQNYGYNYGIS